MVKPLAAPSLVLYLWLWLALGPGCAFAELGGATMSPLDDLSDRNGESSFAAGVAAEVPYAWHPRGIRLAVGAGASLGERVTESGQAIDYYTGPLFVRTDVTVFATRNIYLRATAMGELRLDPREWTEEPSGFLFGPTLTSGDSDLGFQFTFGARYTRFPRYEDIWGIQLRIGIETDFIDAVFASPHDPE